MRNSLNDGNDPTNIYDGYVYVSIMGHIIRSPFLPPTGSCMYRACSLHGTWRRPQCDNASSFQFFNDNNFNGAFTSFKAGFSVQTWEIVNPLQHQQLLHLSFLQRLRQSHLRRLPPHHPHCQCLVHPMFKSNQNHKPRRSLHLQRRLKIQEHSKNSIRNAKVCVVETTVF